MGNFTEEGFAEMAKDVPIRIDTLRRALAKKVKPDSIEGEIQQILST